VGEGLRTRAIAHRMFVAESHVYDKLKLEGRGALMLFAREKGLT